MARIAGVNIPVYKHAWIGLTSIFERWRTISYQICDNAGVNPTTKVRDLDEGTLEKLR